MPSAWRSPKRSSPRATTVDGHAIIDHHTYAIVSDGDLMEGVASEAASLAGHLQLGKLICLYDDNYVTLAGRHRHHVFRRSRGAFRRVRLAHDRRGRRQRSGGDRCRDRGGARGNRATVADSGAHAHRLRLARAGQLQGARLAARRGRCAQDQAETRLADRAADSSIPDAALRAFARGARRAARRPKRRGTSACRRIRKSVSATCRGIASAACAANCRRAGMPTSRCFAADAKGIATRDAGGKVMNAIAPKLPALIGGSADLDPSTKTALKDLGDFNPPATPATTNRVPPAAAGAMPDATCTSACANMRWARSSTAWPRTAASFRTARPS